MRPKHLLQFILPFFLLGVIAVITPDSEYTANSATEQWENAKKFHHRDLQAVALIDLIKDNVQSERWHYEFLELYLNLESFEEDQVVFAAQNHGFSFLKFYQTLAQENSSSDIGHWGLSIYHYRNGALPKANQAFAEIQRIHPFMAKHAIELHLYHPKYDLASLRLAIEAAIDSNSTHPDLITAYLKSKRNTADGRQLILDNGDVVPNELYHQAAYANGDAWHYLKSEFNRILGAGTPFTIAAAGVLFFMWLYFLIGLNSFERTRWKLIILTIGASIMLTFLCSWLYDFSYYTLEIGQPGTIFGDLLYNIFKIGFIEELVKILPLVGIMIFKPQILKTPFDYLLIASLSALTFATLENNMYFSQYGSSIFLQRGYLTALMHMACSATIAYGIVRAKFYSQRKVLPQALLFFLLSISLHGFYDFWMINTEVRFLKIYSYLLWFFLIPFFAGFLTNALNYSPHFNVKRLPNLHRISFALLLGMVIITGVQWTEWWLFHSTNAARSLLISQIYPQYCVALGLAVWITRIEIVEGKWEAFNFKGFGKIFRTQEIVGQSFTVYPANLATSKFAHIYPMNGTIQSRQEIAGDFDWFEMKLARPQKIGTHEFETILIRIKEADEGFNDPDVMIHLRIVRSEALPLSDSKNLSDFPFLEWAVINSSREDA